MAFKQRSFLFLVFALCAIFVSIFIVRGEFIGRIPQDFRTYYCATKTFLAGGNPYSVAEVGKFNGAEIRLPFFYHPYSFFMFAPFLLLSFKNASALFLLFNAVLIVYLLWLWHKFLEGKTKAWLILILLFFGFNQALSVIFQTGNIALLETALIWTAFYFLCKEKAHWFVSFIFFAALFKVLPLVFLPMIFFLSPDKRKGLGKLFGLLASGWLLPFIFKPQLLAQYVNRIVSAPLEKGIINPSSYNLFVDLFGRFSVFLPNLTFIGWALLIGCLFWLSLRKLSWAANKHEIIYLSILTFILVLPRFKGYSYMLAVPIAHDLILENIYLIFLPFLNLLKYVVNINFYVAAYFPLLAILVFWIYLVYNTLTKKTEV